MLTITANTTQVNSVVDNEFAGLEEHQIEVIKTLQENPYSSEEREIIEKSGGIADWKTLLEFYRFVNLENNLNAHIDEQRELILEESIKEKGLPPVLKYDNEFEGLSNLQIEQIEALRKEAFAGKFLWREKTITGEINSDSPKLDLITAKAIISENECFSDIIVEFEKIQKYPDFAGGSGIFRLEYWFDGKGNEKIVVIVEQKQIVFVSLNRQESVMLYPIKSDENTEPPMFSLISPTEATPTPVEFEEPQTLNIADALEILKQLAGMTNTAPPNSTIADAIEILKYLAGMSSKLKF